MFLKVTDPIAFQSDKHVPKGYRSKPASRKCVRVAGHGSFWSAKTEWKAFGSPLNSGNEGMTHEKTREHPQLGCL